KIQVSRLFRTYQGKYILLCYAALDSIADKSEKKNLLVVEASSDLFEVLNKIRQKLLLIIALSLTILLISSLFFSNQVISPILAMIKKIEKISEGNFNERIIISQKNNELNFLAEAFNQMLDNISKLNQILKEKEYNATKRAETIEMKFKESEYLYFLGTMAAIVAHEVRNPLSGISGYVELLERKISEKNENTERLLNKIKEEIKKLNKVTTDFLFLAAPKKMELIKTDIRKMIIDILKLLEKEINVKNIKIENNIKEETFILCDIVYFEKALINIIKNAIAAVDEKNGKIIFECFEKKENNKKYFVLNIKDNGKGIDEETKERLFSLFYTSKKHGIGL
ncbi:MAG TPA: HAMP domain-containing sensor histidine kinase, partial [bacterium]|nr:HAMP domain-containing sensor histidine kinase [bacterium]